MQRPGYGQYGAHGGDAGALITRELGIRRPKGSSACTPVQVFAFACGDPDEMAQITDSPADNRVEQRAVQGMQTVAG
jgi:epoxide hydrolase